LTARLPPLAIAHREQGGHSVGYVVHLDEAEGRPVDTRSLPVIEISTDRLVLAAGTFGSTFLLLKNRRNFRGLSDQLGHYFSGNGDFLGLVHHGYETVDGKRRPLVVDPSHGNVITSTVRIPDTRDGGDGPGFYVQDGGYPGFIDWMIEVGDPTGALSRLVRLAGERIRNRIFHGGQTAVDSELEALIGDARTSAGLLPLLGMGLNTPNGIMSLDEKECLTLDWKADRSDEYFTRFIEAMKEIARALDADFQVDPLWYLRKKVITVHPVGGCSMGNSDLEGVVDSNGEVFNYPGFVIADGSVMPGPVGPNPSFTIAALSDRFAEHQIRSFQ
jgi:cholesterol oxidase